MASKEKPIIFMFAGQGSHCYHMGQVLFQQQPLFRQWMEKADEIHKRITGLSVIEVLYHPQHKKSDLFTQTVFTHPAILMVQHALAQILLAKNIVPAYTLGTSLGEFVSAIFAGILTLEEALHATITQAYYLKKFNAQGGMLAILADPAIYYQMSWLHENITLAAVNFNTHFNVAGKNEALNIAEEHLRKQSQISWQRLPVSQGFHSPAIDIIRPSYQQYLQTITLQPAKLPFISCSTASILNKPSSTHFWDIIRQPILVQKTICALEKQGGYTYIDLSPSGTLATFVKYNLSHDSTSKIHTLMTPYQQDLAQFDSTLTVLQKTMF